MPIHTSAYTPVMRFGRTTTQADVTALKPLLKQIPHLPAEAIDALSPALCAKATLSERVPHLLQFIPLAVEALVDRVRLNRAAARQVRENPDKPVIAIQWVRSKTPFSKALELSSPCTGPSCPVTKDGKPATGRATLGHDMINWIRYA